MSLISSIYNSTATAAWDVKIGQKASQNKAKKQGRRARKAERDRRAAGPLSIGSKALRRQQAREALAHGRAKVEAAREKHPAPAPPTFHGGQIQRIGKKQSAKHLRGLKGWNDGGASGPVRTIVSNGVVLEPGRLKKIKNPSPLLESPVMSRRNGGPGQRAPVYYPSTEDAEWYARQAGE